VIDKEVLVFSAARTGSTLIWQCLSKIFKTVHKRHDGTASPFFKRRVPCVITERNRVESFLSRGRVLRFKNVSSKEFIGALDADLTKAFELSYSGVHEDVKHYQLELNTIEYLKNYYKGKKLILQYEEFFNNYDYIFDQFESFFEFTIPVKTKDLIVAETNLSVNEKIQDKFKDFGSHCEESQIHGKHILSGGPDFYKSIISGENYSRLHDLLWENADEWKELYKDQIKKDNAS
jgi:hypothetical protein